MLTVIVGHVGHAVSRAIIVPAGQPRPGGKCHPLAEAEDVHQMAEFGGHLRQRYGFTFHGTLQRKLELSLIEQFYKRAFTEHDEVRGGLPENLLYFETIRRLRQILLRARSRRDLNYRTPYAVFHGDSVTQDEGSTARQWTIAPVLVS